MKRTDKIGLVLMGGLLLLWLVVSCAGCSSIQTVQDLYEKYDIQITERDENKQGNRS